MWDRIMLVVRIILVLWYIAYLWYLHFSNLPVFAEGVNDILSKIFLIVLVLIAFFIGLFNIKIKYPRLMYFVIWVILIVFAYKYMVDNVDLNVFIWDITRIYWALIIILWLFGALKSQKIEKIQEEEKIEIIEA